ncbi:hypothetical protein KC352_g24704 [Hortaea werneckii]|nr:hypothetical protein KC352_g24704 [Hortaea werneckii]
MNDHQDHYPTFTKYALPDTTIGSEHALSKESSTCGVQGFTHDSGPLPNFLSSEPVGSMANDIFSELGYLGGSIS